MNPTTDTPVVRYDPTAYPSRYVMKANLTPEELEKLKKMLLEHRESLELLSKEEVEKR